MQKKKKLPGIPTYEPTTGKESSQSYPYPAKISLSPCLSLSLSAQRPAGSTKLPLPSQTYTRAYALWRRLSGTYTKSDYVRIITITMQTAYSPTVYQNYEHQTMLMVYGTRSGSATRKVSIAGTGNPYQKHSARLYASTSIGSLPTRQSRFRSGLSRA